MVMEIRIDPIDIPLDNNSRYYAYTLHVDDHRILTVSTNSLQTLSKWLTDLLKSTAKTNHHPIVVGISAECEIVEYTKRGINDQPFDILTLCVGSQCLIYHLDSRDNPYESRDLRPNKPLRAFFDNPNVVAVGMEIDAVAKKLARHHGIEIKNAVDLRALAAKKEEHLDLARYNLDKVAVTVLGKHFDVVRPEKKVEWYEDDIMKWNCELTVEKVQFATVDAYLCFLVGSEMNDVMIYGGSGTENDEAKAKKKNGKREKKKN
ncbi:hypothetical protein Lal_00006188 [Lupinus albus]|uniref:Putative ribonuclease H-like domain-containing protein n=1 Tax=Lupinus albus TaxID=3870 RepID=A0A6A5MWT5_LUPAL|nr:putative ribonuclease H-like domain-containing protein [Lupinus albus]KAF1875560.1 hypothetical protein Lal_00006188 [Lupinus albus]